MNFSGKSCGGTDRGVLHLNGVRLHQMQKHQGLQLDQRALFRQKRRGRLAKIEQSPPFAVPIERCVG